MAGGVGTDSAASPSSMTDLTPSPCMSSTCPYVSEANFAGSLSIPLLVRAFRARVGNWIVLRDSESRSACLGKTRRSAISAERVRKRLPMKNCSAAFALESLGITGRARSPTTAVGESPQHSPTQAGSGRYAHFVAMACGRRRSDLATMWEVAGSLKCQDGISAYSIDKGAAKSKTAFCCLKSSCVLP
jgi:hypothetical protein